MSFGARFMIAVRPIELREVKGSHVRGLDYFGNAGPVRVEQAGLDYYRALGLKGIWSENDYWVEIMSLLFWGFIGTLALFEEDFYQVRKKVIKKHIETLSPESVLQLMLRISYAEHYELPSRYVNNWQRYSIDELCAAPDNMSNDQLFRIMKRLLINFNRNRSGMPDLFFYNPKIQFVEVKAQGDSLRQNQIGWIRFLARTANIPVELLLINHTERKIASVEKEINSVESRV